MLRLGSMLVTALRPLPPPKVTWRLLRTLHLLIQTLLQRSSETLWVVAEIGQLPWHLCLNMSHEEDQKPYRKRKRHRQRIDMVAARDTIYLAREGRRETTTHLAEINTLHQRCQIPLPLALGWMQVIHLQGKQGSYEWVPWFQWPFQWACIIQSASSPGCAIRV